MAERQWGVIKRHQLRCCGLSDTSIARWIARGLLRSIHPGVFAFGHRALRMEGRLAAALLYAGSGAALSHTTAAWWWHLLDTEPRRIHLSVPRWRRPLRDVAIHMPRRIEAQTHRGFRVTTVPRTLLDIASSVPFDVLRQALAQAEHQRLAGLEEVASVLSRGQPGSRALRSALRQHAPEMAHTRSRLEERFIALCERHGIPTPEVNVRLHGFMVDALWRDQRLVVELDGGTAHGTFSAVTRDRHRDLVLREHGFRVRRYSGEQVHAHASRVAADVLVGLSATRSVHPSDGS